MLPLLHRISNSSKGPFTERTFHMRHALLFSLTLLCGTATVTTSLAAAPTAAPVQLVADDKHDHKEGDKADEYKGEKKDLGKRKIRGWIGIESAKGSIRSAAEDEEKEYHLHHQVSKPIPQAAKETSKLWIEVETSAGKKNGSFDFAPHDEKAHDHAESK
jgi:hypothetical protein